MKSPFTAHLSLVGQLFQRARMDKHVVRPMREKQPKFNAPLIERPIRSIGRFFAKLDQAEQKAGRKLAREARYLSRATLEAGYRRLEQAAKSRNFQRVV